MTRDTRDKIELAVMFVLFLPGLGTLMAAVITLAYQSLTWLRYGAWEDHSTWEIIRYFGIQYHPTEYVGLNRIIVWLLDMPMFAGFVFAALPLMWIGNWLLRESQKVLQAPPSG